jgi:nitrite reductase/ring-hydroxylating ferredoxin subunit
MAMPSDRQVMTLKHDREKLQTFAVRLRQAGREQSRSGGSDPGTGEPECIINTHPATPRFDRRTVAGPGGRRGGTMAEKLVGKVSEFKNGDRRIVFFGNHEIGVFREHDTFYAYSNYCLHQGGPACEGLTIAKVEERIMPDKTSKGLYFSDTELHFVCPWHGYEYDIKTGECVSDRRLKLRKYEVIEKGDEVYVRT